MTLIKTYWKPIAAVLLIAALGYIAFKLIDQSYDRKLQRLDMETDRLTDSLTLQREHIRELYQCLETIDGEIVKQDEKTTTALKTYIEVARRPLDTIPAVEQERMVDDFSRLPILQRADSLADRLHKSYK